MQNQELKIQKLKLLKSLDKFLEGPMIFLSLLWLILLIIELIYSLNNFLQLATSIIWIIFILDFTLKLILAPKKIAYIKHNWLTVLSLIVPALRLFKIFRVVRLLRFARGSRLLRVISSVNRGMKSLNATMQRRGFSYIMVLTIVITFAGAAGMFAFENKPGGLQTYGEALWWTIMLLISVGSAYWPETIEGRTLCILLGLYGFTVFGYITATLASFFVGRDAEEKNAPIAGSNEIAELKTEIQELKNILKNIDSKIV